MENDIKITVGEVLTVKRISAKIDKFGAITREYVGISNLDTETIINSHKGTIEVKLKQNQYGSKLEFPNIGSSNLLYVDVTENKTYRWDGDMLAYICVGSDYNDIKVINGGKANNG